MRPYTTHVNTFHVPTVESTLLQTFIKGTEFRRTAPLVFQDTLEGTMRYLQMGGHLQEPENATLADFISVNYSLSLDAPPSRIGLQSIGWSLSPKQLVWVPKQLDRLLSQQQQQQPLRKAEEYLVLLALFFRVNGAANLLQQMRGLFHGGQMPKTDVLPEKIDAFIQTHFPLAKALDALDDPRDEMVARAGINIGLLAKPLGQTEYREDRDLIRIEKRTIKLELTPVELLQRHATIKRTRKPTLVPEEFLVDVDVTLAKIAHSIRSEPDDAILEDKYVREHEDDAFDHYYPVRMQSAGECRLHSWYLACLHMINLAWEHANAFDEAEKQRLLDEWEAEETVKKEKTTAPPKKKEEENVVTRFIRGGLSRGKGDPVKWLNGGFVHSMAIRHAFHRCMGAFVDLFFHALSENKISDELWRSDISSGSPSLLDKFFPYDTACFHWVSAT